jgi:hypothetical protein
LTFLLGEALPTGNQQSVDLASGLLTPQIGSQLLLNCRSEMDLCGFLLGWSESCYIHAPRISPVRLAAFYGNTVKFTLLVKVPLEVVTVTWPVVAAAGSVAFIKVPRTT